MVLSGFLPFSLPLPYQKLQRDQRIHREDAGAHLGPEPWLTYPALPTIPLFWPQEPQAKCTEQNKNALLRSKCISLQAHLATSVFILSSYMSLQLSIRWLHLFLTLNVLGWRCSCLVQNQETHQQGIKRRSKQKVLPQVRIRFYHAWPPEEGKRDGRQGVMIRTQAQHHAHMEKTKMFGRRSKTIPR